MSIRWKNGAVRCPLRTGIKKQSWLDFDPFYMSLGSTSNERAVKYWDWLRETVPEGEWKVIRDATYRGQLTADRKFEREINEFKNIYENLKDMVKERRPGEYA